MHSLMRALENSSRKIQHYQLENELVKILWHNLNKEILYILCNRASLHYSERVCV